MTNMVEIINYIMNNFIWVIVAVIIILLAIIGGYADRTNFGEGKKIVKVNKKDKDKDLIDELQVEKKEEPIVNDLDEMLNSEKEEEPKEESINTDGITIDLSSESKEPVDNVEESKELTTEEFLKTDDLDVLLPKKEKFNDDLLQELDDISFDFKKKKTSSLVSDFYDLDLPSIKKKQTTTDIWK